MAPATYLDVARLGRWPLLAGFVARVVAWSFAEPFYGDAPIRMALSWRLMDAGRLGWAWPDVFQFGPLPLVVGSWLARWDEQRGPAILSVACGTVSILLAMRVASRFVPGDDARAPTLAWIGWLVALGPLHVQTSTTFLSEPVYLAAALWLMDASFARAPWQAAAAIFVASTSRYDLWLVLPAWVAWWSWTAGVSLRSVVTAGALAAPGPLSVLLANHVATGDAWVALSHIRGEHVALGASVEASLGPLWGRLRAVAFWPAVTFVIVGPVAAWQAWRALPTVLVDRTRWVAWLVGWGAPLVYVARALATNAFYPMGRLAILPSTVLAMNVVRPSRRLRTGSIAALVLLDLALLSTSLFAGPTAARFVSTVTPLSRWPDDLRTAGGWLREDPRATVVEPAGDWEDIALATSIGVRVHDTLHPLRHEGPVRHAIVRDGGPLDAAWLARPPPNLRRVATFGRFVRWSKEQPETP